MAAYKAKYEEALKQIEVYKTFVADQARTIEYLNDKLKEMSSLDSMTELIEDSEAKEFVMGFINRCQNRAEVALLVRAISKLN